MKTIKSKMVVCISVAALLLADVSNTSAQEGEKRKKAEFGFRFMPTFTSLKLQTSTGSTVSGEVTLGYGIGALLGYNISNHVGIQGEIMYSSISQKFKNYDVEHKVNLRYINVPLLLTLNSGKSKVINLNVVAGPQMGFNVGSRLTTTGNSDAVNPQPVLSVKKGDLGFAYGAGIDIALNSNHSVCLSLGYRGVLGLIDISNQSKAVTNNSYYILDRTHVKTNAVYAGLTLMF